MLRRKSFLCKFAHVARCQKANYREVNQVLSYISNDQASSLLHKSEPIAMELIESDSIKGAAIAKQNIRFKDLAISPTLGLNEMQKLLQSRDQNIYKFGFGQSPMPVPDCLVKKLVQYAHMKDYLPVEGLDKLRESISNHYNERVFNHHKDITPDRIIVSPGSKQAFFLLKLALSHCSEILLPSPSWVSYAPQSKILGHKVVFLDTNFATKWKLRADVLENHLKHDSNKQRLLILNTPNNPTGVKYTYAELEDIARVCRKYQVFILSDEIYGDLYHDEDDSYFSIYDLYPENTIVTNGLSKSFGAGGWRLGFMIFPASLALLEPVFIAASETHTSVSAPIQYAACEAFDAYDGDEIQSYLKIKRKILSALSCRMYELLSDIEGCKVVKPNGGFYIFPDFSNVKNIDRMIQKWMTETGKSRHEWNSTEFSMFLLKETGVACLAGSCFGRKANELTMRLSYVDFDGTALLSRLDTTQLDDIHVNSEKMDDILIEYCCKTVQGMQVLYDYMNSL